MKILNLVAAAVVATGCFATSAFAAGGIELTSNGNFETGDFTDWEIFDNGGEISITGDTPVFGGSFAGLVQSADSATSNPTLKQERVGQGIVQNNQDVHISFQAKGSAANGGVHFAQFITEAAVGGSSNTFLNPLILTDEWQPFSYTVNTGLNDISGGVTLQFVAATGAVAGANSTFFVDNASMTVVPEPSSFAMLGIGGLGLVARRRRR